MIMKKEIKTIDAECNNCDWKGFFQNMIKPENDEDVYKCPRCQSENIYYYKNPPRYLNIIP